MDLYALFLLLGGLFIVGLLANEVGRRTRLPRVTLLILFGTLAGPSGFDILPAVFQDWYEFLTSAALTMVAFLLGGKLSLAHLRRHGRAILIISLAAVLTTGLFVGGALVIAGAPLVLALLFAGISTATDPAATQDVVRQTGAAGPFTDTLTGVVAVDDAWGLITFSILLLLAKAITGDGGADILLHGLREVGGAIVIGAGVGVPAAFVSKRLRAGEPIQAEALGVVFLCAGLAIWADVSFLLAGMVAGAAVANFDREDQRPFREIEHFQWPFIVLFFVLAGASLDIGALRDIGLIGLVFLLARAAGRVIGGWIGCALSATPPNFRGWMGTSLIPQAGVAIGMALVAGSHFPDAAQTILAVTIGTTILFEIFGPISTQIALARVGETGKQDSA